MRYFYLLLVITVHSSLFAQPCEIYNLSVSTGDCTSNTSYQLSLDFQVQNPSNQTFDLWANNAQFIGTFQLNQLPITIPNFPYNGGNNDVLKVCINDNPNCCKIAEFPVPNCINNPQPCEIYNLSVSTGDCTSNTSYQLSLDFQVQNPSNQAFDLWANNAQFIGTFQLNQLPLTIPNFPYNGGNNDVLKVCINDNPNCCKIAEFLVPSCINNQCEIKNLNAEPAPCLDGVFLVQISFEYSNNLSDSFILMVNNELYQTYEYNTPQPLLIGPFPGDGTTNYSFTIKDQAAINCKNVYELGKISCPENRPKTGEFVLVTAPNPVYEGVSIQARSGETNYYGTGVLYLFDQNGRLIQRLTVSQTAYYFLQTAALPAGKYSLILSSEGQQFYGDFFKL